MPREKSKFKKVSKPTAPYLREIRRNKKEKRRIYDKVGYFAIDTLEGTLKFLYPNYTGYTVHFSDVIPPNQGRHNSVPPD